MTYIVRRFYETALECTRGNDNDDEFICKNVVVFGPCKLDLAYNKTVVVIGVLKDKNPSLVLITIARGERERCENERSEGEEEGSELCD